MTEIPARMLRYYEEQGLITPQRRENGYRDYDEALIERAEKIKCFVDAGVPTRAIEPILNCLGNSTGVPQPDTPAELGAMLVRERDRMAERVARLEKNLTSLTNLIRSMGIEEGVTVTKKCPPPVQ
jgi:DNA-binding transcriptional MerR regulator